MGRTTLSGVAPGLWRLLHYRREDLRSDLTAGVTVAVMYVPQGMAYAMLAGLPPVAGLYAATLPLLVYGLLGSAPQLAVGPVAIVSLMVYAACEQLAEPGSAEYAGLAALLALMVGGLKLAMGLARLGFVVRFLSHAVISGFTSAAAVTIGLSQLKHLLGVDAGEGESALKIVISLAPGLVDVHALTLTLGAAALAGILVLARIAPRVPAPILVVLGTTVATWALGLGEAGVRTVGAVPAGLPPLAPPLNHLGLAQSLAPAAVTIALASFMESIAVSKFLAAKEKTRVEPDQELRALGAANLVAGLFSAYPVTGGLSRTAVNYRAGARTTAASMISAILVLVTLAFLTPVFHHLPKAVLAAIIIGAVTSLIDPRQAVRLFRIQRHDGWSLLVTFLVTLGVGIEQGIVTGLVLSLLLFIWRSAHPHTAELGYVEERRAFLNTRRYPDATRAPGTLILRVDAPLYFANMEFVGDLVRRLIAERPQVSRVVLDFSGVNEMDAVAALELGDLVEGYQQHGIRFALARVKGPVRDVLARAGWHDSVGGEVHYPSVSAALQAVAPPKARQGSSGASEEDS